MSTLEIKVDAEPQNSDWTKQSWDLPPYKSPEFMALSPDLETFRHLPVYEHAVAKGLIVNDEWVGKARRANKLENIFKFNKNHEPAGSSKGGQFASSRAAEYSSAALPKAGQKILIYRVGRASETSLAGRNGGDANAVAVHLARMDDFGSPQQVGVEASDTINIYEVTLLEDAGEYVRLSRGKMAETEIPVGYNGKGAFSFGKAGKSYVEKKIGTVSVADVRAVLKQQTDYDNFDDSGSKNGAQAIREAAKLSLIHKYNKNHEPAGSPKGGQFAKKPGGASTGGQASSPPTGSGPLYVSRLVTNAKDIIEWAKSIGLESTLPPEKMHVTVAFSKTGINWEDAGSSAEKVVAGEGRELRLEKTTNRGNALLLFFDAPTLKERWQAFLDAGATWDRNMPEYRSHITIAYDVPDDFDVSKVKPYQGPITMGPEEFEALNLNWSKTASENKIVSAIKFNKNHEPAGSPIGGRFARGPGTPVRGGFTLSSSEEVLALHNELAEEYSDWANSLSWADKDSLKAYVSLEAESYNAAMRRGERLPPLVAKQLDEVDQVLANAGPTKTDLIVYRGVRIASEDFYQEGNTITDAAFMSTSINPTVAWQFSVYGGQKIYLLRIKVPKGSTGAYIAAASGKIGSGAVSEREFLLPRNTKLTITKVNEPEERAPGSGEGINGMVVYVDAVVETPKPKKPRKKAPVWTEVKRKKEGKHYRVVSGHKYAWDEVAPEETKLQKAVRTLKFNKNHDKLGRFASAGTAGLAEPKGEYTATQRNWLQDLKRKQKAFEKKNPDKIGIRYDTDLDAPKFSAEAMQSMLTTFSRFSPYTVESFVLREGEEHTVPTENPKVKLGEPKQCFQNAAQLVMRENMLNFAQGKDGRYQYAEGKIFMPGLPLAIDHAWVVDRETNTVIDPTLGWNPSARYYGVKVSNNFLRKKLVENQFYGLMNNGWGPTKWVLGEDEDYSYRQPTPEPRAAEEILSDLKR